MLSSDKTGGAVTVAVKISVRFIVFIMTAIALSLSILQVCLSKTLTGLMVDKSSNNLTQLRLDFDGTAVMPKAYQLDKPSRLVLDFNNVANGLSLQQYDIQQGTISTIESLSSEADTRLIVHLNPSAQSPTFMSMAQNDSLLVNINQQQKVANTHRYGKSLVDSSQPSVINYGSEQLKSLPSPTRKGREQRSQFYGLDNLAYSRPNQGEGTLSIKLIDETALDIQRRGNKVMIRLLGAAIPQQLLGQHHVNDGLVDKMTVMNKSTSKGEEGLITLSMPKDFEYQAYQAGKQFTLTIKPAQLLHTPVVAKKKYTGQPMSMDFQNVEVRSALHLLSEFTEMNIVVSDAVTGKITLNLINVPWDQTLDLILQSKQLAMQKQGNVILVAPIAEVAERNLNALEAQQQLADRLPLRTEYVRLNYAKASNLVNLISQARNSSALLTAKAPTSKGLTPVSQVGALLSGRGSITVDTRTNTLIVRDTAASLENIHELIAKIDIPVRQVMIEVRIVSATDSFSKEMGVKWGVLSKGVANNDTLLVGGSTQTLADLKQFTIENTTINSKSVSSPKYAIHRPDNLNVDLGVSNAAGRIAFGLLSMSDLMIDLELSAMQADGRGEVISTPKILTMDKQTAKVSSGTKIPYQSESEGGGTTTQFEEAVLSLEVTPNITPEGKIALQLNIENGRPNPVGQGIILIDTDTLSTNVTIDDGQTIVLGGIYRNQIFNNVEKVPFFGDIPYMGHLFKKDLRRNDKQELLIFVTPKLIDEQVESFY